MNVSAKRRTLIIGIGNPLRSDDGLGWAVVEHLSQQCDTNCDIHMVHQLTPDVAQWMADANLVIMIDASHQGEAGELHIRPLSSAQPGAVGTHHTTPEELAALTTVIYGRCAPVVLVSLTGADFSIGEHLSAVISQKLSLVGEVVRQLCRDKKIGT
jgi:hydrogenase maturation protease